MDTWNRRPARSEVFDQLSVVSKAFASPKRLELIDLLTQGERTVDSLAREADMGLTTASAHLQVLKLSNLVRTRKDGTRVHYRLAGEDICALFDTLRRVAAVHSPDVERALGSYLGTREEHEIAHDLLEQEMKDPMTRLIDVRPQEEFAAGHIPGADTTPFGEVAGHAKDWAQGVHVIAYCRGAHCVMASDAVRMLRAEGVKASRLEAGMLEWRLAGRPVEVTQ